MRQPRDKRRRGVQVSLSERDEALLRALARFRMARTQELASLAFRDVRVDTATARLRRLYDAGLLGVTVAERAGPNVYHLGHAGREWAHAHGIAVGKPPRGSLAHHLAIVRTWVSLARLAEELPGVRLARFRPDWEIREALPAGMRGVVPDAIARLEVQGASGEPTSVAFAVEVDLDTESLRVLGQKLRTYVAQLVADGELFGVSDAGLAVVLGSATPRRRQALEALLEAAWPSWWLTWGLDEGPGKAIAELHETIGGSPYALPLRQGEGGARNA